MKKLQELNRSLKKRLTRVDRKCVEIERIARTNIDRPTPRQRCEEMDLRSPVVVDNEEAADGRESMQNCRGNGYKYSLKSFYTYGA